MVWWFWRSRVWCVRSTSAGVSSHASRKQRGHRRRWRSQPAGRRSRTLAQGGWRTCEKLVELMRESRKNMAKGSAKQLLSDVIDSLAIVYIKAIKSTQNMCQTKQNFVQNSSQNCCTLSRALLNPNYQNFVADLSSFWTKLQVYLSIPRCQGIPNEFFCTKIIVAELHFECLYLF